MVKLGRKANDDDLPQADSPEWAEWAKPYLAFLKGKPRTQREVVVWARQEGHHHAKVVNVLVWMELHGLARRERLPKPASGPAPLLWSRVHLARPKALPPLPTKCPACGGLLAVAEESVRCLSCGRSLAMPE